MSYIQETDPRIVASLLAEYSLFILDDLDGKDETSNGRPDLRFPSFLAPNRIISAWGAVGQAKDEKIAPPLSEDNRFIDDLNDTDETYSGRPDLRFPSLLALNRIISAWGAVGQAKDEKIAPPLSEGNRFIDDLNDTDETYSGRPDLRFPSLLALNRIISAWGAVEQAKDEKIAPSLSEGNRFIDDLNDMDETYSGRPDLRFLSLSVQSLIIPAWGDVGQVEDEKVADEARRILSIIAETILIFQKRAVDLEHLPRLHAFDVQDGSILIEWIFDDFRVGFSIEPILTESSWYLVSNAKLGDIGDFGNISQDESETQNLILKLLGFVLSHV